MHITSYVLLFHGDFGLVYHGVRVVLLLVGSPPGRRGEPLLYEMVWIRGLLADHSSGYTTVEGGDN
jgi:hypothetical protein